MNTYLNSKTKNQIPINTSFLQIAQNTQKIQIQKVSRAGGEDAEDEKRNRTGYGPSPLEKVSATGGRMRMYFNLLLLYNALLLRFAFGVIG